MQLKRIVGITKQEFDSLVDGESFELNSRKEINVRPARLIPTYKPGSEMALTSIFLSSLCLIKEFKDLFFSEIKFPKSGQIFVYTEFEIKGEKNERPDGILLLVKGGKIVDAVIFEMKNGNAELDKTQIERYVALANKYKIPRLVTVSNQYVSNPTQSPVNVKIPKSVQLYHFSWSYLLTLARVLLFDNDTNINDPDQVAIMQEVVAYLESKVSGVCGFTRMKSGWKDAVQKINSNMKLSDDLIAQAVTSWQQEERDMALILSRELGAFVKTSSAKYKNLQDRFNDDKKDLIENRELNITLKIANAVSDIQIKASFKDRTVEMSVKVSIPKDKTVKGQIGWLARQFKKCEQNLPEKFKSLFENIRVDFNIKHARNTDNYPWREISYDHTILKDKIINGVNIALVKNFGTDFASPVKFVSNIEEMLIDYYQVIVQNFKNWEPDAPKIPKEEN